MALDLRSTKRANAKTLIFQNDLKTQAAQSAYHHVSHALDEDPKTNHIHSRRNTMHLFEIFWSVFSCLFLFPIILVSLSVSCVFQDFVSATVDVGQIEFLSIKKSRTDVSLPNPAISAVMAVHVFPQCCNFATRDPIFFVNGFNHHSTPAPFVVFFATIPTVTCCFSNGLLSGPVFVLIIMSSFFSSA